MESFIALSQRKVFDRQRLTSWEELRRRSPPGTTRHAIAGVIGALVA
nr:hypothetical protein JVH1_0108 [Rhodococcus sp. JVH1]